MSVRLLLVVDTQYQAALLNRVLEPGSRAVAALSSLMGDYYDDYMLLLSPSAVNSREQRDAVQLWLKTSVETKIKPERVR